MIIRDEHIRYSVILGPINYDIYEDLNNRRISVYVPPLEDIIKENPQINDIIKERGNAMLLSDSLLYRLLKLGSPETTRILYVGSEFIDTLTVELKELREARKRLTVPQFFVKELVRMEKLFEKASIPEKVNILAELTSLEDILNNQDIQQFDLKSLDGIIDEELTRKFKVKVKDISENIPVEHEFMSKDDFYTIFRQQLLK